VFAIAKINQNLERQGGVDQQLDVISRATNFLS